MIRDVRLSGPTLKLLRLLVESPERGRSGADISRATNIGSSTLYPLLQRLEAAGWLTSVWEEIDPADAGRPRRRFYTLTPEGLRHALRELQALQFSPTGAPAWG